VYSTCSILELQNDGVVGRLLERAQGAVAVVSHTLCAPGAPPATAAAAAARVAALDGCAERTRHGWLVMPDGAGAGPMYVAVLHKVGCSDLRRTKVNKYARDEGSEM
jgi:16S rRNA C967 or C1407 C5-methylase (RsmB/RsmF family)